MYVPLSEQEDDEPAADRAGSRVEIARAARSQPATGSHSITRATQKCSRKRVEHLVQVSPAVQARAVDSVEQAPDSGCEPHRLRGCSSELAQPAVLPERERQQRGCEPERRTASSARRACDDQQQCGRDEEDRVRRLDRDRPTPPPSPAAAAGCQLGRLERAQAEDTRRPAAPTVAGKSGTEVEPEELRQRQLGVLLVVARAPRRGSRGTGARSRAAAAKYPKRRPAMRLAIP